MLFMHISDIHFKKLDVAGSLDPNNSLRNEIMRDIEDILKPLHKTIDGIVVSGDIAYAGKPEEFNFAYKWLMDLAKVCGCRPENIVVCPGNHDVDREKAGQTLVTMLVNSIKEADDLNRDALLSGHLRGADTATQLFKPLEAYNDFAVRFFCDLEAPDRTLAMKELERENGTKLEFSDGTRLKIWALNSALISGPGDEVDGLCVAQSYTQIVRRADEINLVLCHHPYSWIKGGGHLRDHLQGVSQIQLFGHEHTQRVLLSRNYVALSAGAMQPDPTEPAWKPGYNVFELEVIQADTKRALQVAVHARGWNPTSHRFSPIRDDTAGKDTWEWEIPLDPWKKASDDISINDNTKTSLPVEKAPSAAGKQKNMATFHELSMRFFELPVNEKTEIVGKLKLAEENDSAFPNYVRARKMLERAASRNLLDDLEKEITRFEKLKT